LQVKSIYPAFHFTCLCSLYFHFWHRKGNYLNLSILSPSPKSTASLLLNFQS
jgi:hypothetical protein